jgi:hypothetical protein
VALWFYPVDFYGAVNGAGIVKQLWKLLLDIVPGDIASPFLKGNSLQIIFLAVCSGLIMLMLGKQTENVLTDVGQINNIVLTGMNSVSVLTPYIVFVCVLNMIISGINIPTITAPEDFPAGVGCGIPGADLLYPAAGLYRPCFPGPDL